MKRKILFRAKAADSNTKGIKKGQWVEGCCIETDCDAPAIVFGDGEQVTIDEDTLGQYIGLEINGRKVFEGDQFDVEIRMLPDNSRPFQTTPVNVTVTATVVFRKLAFVGRSEFSGEIGGQRFTNRVNYINLKSDYDYIRPD